MPADRVLVVGAGPTGLTAALELRRRGFRVRIVDRKAGPTPLSKAVGIAPNSLDILEPSGVTAALLSAGIQVRRGHAWCGTRELGTIELSRIPHRFNFLLSLPQSETERIMADALAHPGEIEKLHAPSSITWRKLARR